MIQGICILRLWLKVGRSPRPQPSVSRRYQGSGLQVSRPLEIWRSYYFWAYNNKSYETNTFHAAMDGVCNEYGLGTNPNHARRPA